MIFKLEVEDLLQKDPELNLASAGTHRIVPRAPAVGIWIFLLPLYEERLKLSDDLSSIRLIIEILDQILTFLKGNISVYALAKSIANLGGALIRHLGLNMHLQ